jgi:hypothetical protein
MTSMEITAALPRIINASLRKAAISGSKTAQQCETIRTHTNDAYDSHPWENFFRLGLSAPDADGSLGLQAAFLTPAA